jgi:hypothetical protein
VLGASASDLSSRRQVAEQLQRGRAVDVGGLVELLGQLVGGLLELVGRNRFIAPLSLWVAQCASLADSIRAIPTPRRAAGWTIGWRR